MLIRDSAIAFSWDMRLQTYISWLSSAFTVLALASLLLPAGYGALIDWLAPVLGIWLRPTLTAVYLLFTAPWEGTAAIAWILGGLVCGLTTRGKYIKAVAAGTACFLTVMSLTAIGFLELSQPPVTGWYAVLSNLPPVPETFSMDEVLEIPSVGPQVASLIESLERGVTPNIGGMLQTLLFNAVVNMALHLVVAVFVSVYSYRYSPAKFVLLAMTIICIPIAVAQPSRFLVEVEVKESGMVNIGILVKNVTVPELTEKEGFSFTEMFLVRNGIVEPLGFLPKPLIESLPESCLVVVAPPEATKKAARAISDYRAGVFKRLLPARLVHVFTIKLPWGLLGKPSYLVVYRVEANKTSLLKWVYDLLPDFAKGMVSLQKISDKFLAALVYDPDRYPGGAQLILITEKKGFEGTSGEHMASLRRFAGFKPTVLDEPAVFILSLPRVGELELLSYNPREGEYDRAVRILRISLSPGKLYTDVNASFTYDFPPLVELTREVSKLRVSAGDLVKIVVRARNLGSKPVRNLVIDDGAWLLRYPKSIKLVSGDYRGVWPQLRPGEEAVLEYTVYIMSEGYYYLIPAKADYIWSILRLHLSTKPTVLKAFFNPVFFTVYAINSRWPYSALFLLIAVAPPLVETALALSRKLKTSKY